MKLLKLAKLKIILRLLMLIQILNPIFKFITHNLVFQKIRDILKNFFSNLKKSRSFRNLNILSKKETTLKNNKGVAILLAIFTTTIILYLVMEVTYQTNVEYVINANSINRLKAYYAAKAGVEFSLLRIKIYQKVNQQFGSQIPAAQKKLLDLIWSFPFAWPPIMPSEISSVDKDLINKSVKESKLEGSFRTDIFDEGSKIDINDLDSPSQVIRENTQKLLLGLFESKKENDEKWAKTHDEAEYKKLINNIIDWEDKDQTGLNGGDERSLYEEMHRKYETDVSLPPNRGFRTVDELRLVAGMTEEYFNLLKNNITIYGMKAINPNYASQDVIKSLDASITNEIVSEVMKHRDPMSGTPFTNAQEFWDFLFQKGARIDMTKQQQVPLIFDKVNNFKIRSVGDFAGQTREIELVVFDFSSVAGAVAQNLKSEWDQKNNPIANNNNTNNKNAATANIGKNNNAKADPIPKGPPRIVYYYER